MTENEQGGRSRATRIKCIYMMCVLTAVHGRSPNAHRVDFRLFLFYFFLYIFFYKYWDREGKFCLNDAKRANASIRDASIDKLNGYDFI